MMTPPTNIVWIVWDACRADFTLTKYRGRDITPNLAALTEDAVSFKEAFSAAPWTPPSHASMFTGQYPSTHGYLDDGMTLGATHIAEILSDAGYQTVSLIGSSKIGSQTPLSASFDTVYDLFRLPRIGGGAKEIWKYYGRILGDWIKFSPQYLLNRQKSGYITTSLLKHHISRTKGPKSQFLFANFLAPHSKYAPPEPYRTCFENEYESNRQNIVNQLCLRGGYRFMADEISVRDTEWQAVKDRYAGEIAYVDSLLGELIDHMKREGVYEETMLVVTADHGEHFGEHGRAYHQFSLYDELLRVPLIIKFPNREYAGTEVSELASTVDLFPTTLAVAGVAEDQGQGESLIPPGEVSRKVIFAEYGEPVAGIKALKNNTASSVSPQVMEELDTALQCGRTKTHKLIRRSNGKQEAYALSTDISETKDLLDGANAPPEIRTIAEQMDKTLSELPEVRPETSDEVTIQQNLKALGYR